MTNADTPTMTFAKVEVDSGEYDFLTRYHTEVQEAEARCCPEDVGFEEWIGVLKKHDNVVAYEHLQSLVSLLLDTMKPIGPMRDRGDYPVELQRAIDFLHDRPTPSGCPPIGFAVRMAEGAFVGIWQDRQTAEHVCSKQPATHGDQVIPVYARATP